MSALSDLQHIENLNEFLSANTDCITPVQAAIIKGAMDRLQIVADDIEEMEDDNYDDAHELRIWFNQNCI